MASNIYLAQRTNTRKDGVREGVAPGEENIDEDNNSIHGNDLEGSGDEVEEHEPVLGCTSEVNNDRDSGKHDDEEQEEKEYGEDGDGYMKGDTNKESSALEEDGEAQDDRDSKNDKDDHSQLMAKALSKYHKDDAIEAALFNDPRSTREKLPKWAEQFHESAITINSPRKKSPHKYKALDLRKTKTGRVAKDTTKATESSGALVASRFEAEIEKMRSWWVIR